MVSWSVCESELFHLRELNRELCEPRIQGKLWAPTAAHFNCEVKLELSRPLILTRGKHPTALVLWGKTGIGGSQSPRFSSRRWKSSLSQTLQTTEPCPVLSLKSMSTPSRMMMSLSIPTRAHRCPPPTLTTLGSSWFNTKASDSTLTMRKSQSAESSSLQIRTFPLSWLFKRFLSDFTLLWMKPITGIVL